MPHYVVDKVTRALNERRKALNGSRILLIGLAYKPDVNDVRDSPAFDVAEALRERGGQVSYHDPHVPSAELNGVVTKSVPLSAGHLTRQDCVVILTNHSTVDYDLILRHAPLIVDTRNQYRRLRRAASHVTRL
jgi:UDP-N-acetyl-D-glucosamine dehydrogenase